MSNLVYLILLVLPTYLIKFNLFGLPINFLEIVIWIVFLIFLIFSFIRKDFSKKIIVFLKNPFFIPWILFFSAGIISIFFSPDKRISLGIFKAYFIDSSMFIFMLLSLIKTKEELKKCFFALLTSALVLSFVGISQYLFYPQYLQDGRIKAFFSSPNYLSLYLTPLIFLIPIMISKNGKEKLLPWVCLVVIAATIFLTYSRGAWLGLILGAIVFLGIYFIQKVRSKKVKIIIPILVLLLAISSLPFITKGVYNLGIVSTNRIYTSDNVRKEIWTTSSEILSKNWLFGVGLGNFQKYFGDYTKDRINYPEYITPNALTPHNIILNIWLQTGLLGIISFIVFLFIFFIKCFRNIKANPVINVILISSMVAILGQGLVDSSIWKNDLIIIYYFILFSSVIISNSKIKEN